jgi:hypothetical protein
MRIQRRGQLLAEGYDDGELRRRVRRGELVVVRRGAYVGRDELPDSAESRHLVRLRAALPDLAPDAVVSHATAAVAHGLPLWSVGLARLHVTRSRRGGSRVTPHLHVHAAALDPDDVTLLHGIAVTTAARTVVDLACCEPFEVAVVVADGALRRGRTTPSELAAALRRAEGRPGSRGARRALAFADGLSDGPGESRSRVRMRDAGLPAPVLQMPVRTRLGQVWVDFGWPGAGVVGEFDGLVKYGARRRPGEDAAGAVVREKLREDAVRDEGLRVVRWTWRELDPFDAVAERLRRHFR